MIITSSSVTSGVCFICDVGIKQFEDIDVDVPFVASKMNILEK
jgi:hypothetical protein